MHGLMAFEPRPGMGIDVGSFQVPDVTANNLAPLIARLTHPDSRFVTDEVLEATERWSPAWLTILGTISPRQSWKFVNVGRIVFGRNTRVRVLGMPL